MTLYYTPYPIKSYRNDLTSSLAGRMTARHRHFIPFLLVFGGVYLANAWVCDDAYITFRSIDNLVNGLGPVWNAGERVQAFTHPLWFLLRISAKLTSRFGPS